MGSSTADKHHSTHKHHSSKRKEPPAGVAAPSPKKTVTSDHKSGQPKPSGDAQQALLDRHRHAVSALYTAYEQLSSASASADDHAAAFDVLLEGAKGGTCAQRVAARLIPRFVHRFPLKLEQAGAALITITASHSSSKDPESVRALSKAARPEALHGLAKVCEAASGVASSSGGAVVTKVAEVLLRRLSSEVNGRTSTGVGAGTSEPQCALQSLQAAFRSSTRVILATSLQGLKSEDGKTRDGSRFFLQQLLAVPQPSPAAAGVTANGHGGSGAAAMEQCLAAEVLATQTDTQHWLRNTAAAFRAEPPKHRAKEALALLDRLLQALPPDVPPHLAALASAAGAGAATVGAAPPPPLPPGQPGKPLPLPPPPLHPAAAVSPAHAERSAPATPRDDDDDVAMDLEEGQLADSPVAAPPLPPLTAAGTSQPPPPPPDPGAGEAAAVAQPQAQAAMRPGGMLCRAAPTLWLGNVPRLIGESAVRKECSKAGRVSSIECPRRDEAFITFQGMREAAVAYEQLCRRAPWGGTPLDVQFCAEDSPAAGPQPRPVAVWVCGPCNQAAEAEVVATLKAAGVPPASGVLRVGGNRPGLMMQFPDEAAGDAALAALRDGSASGALPRQDGAVGCTVVVSQVSPAVHERELLHAFSRFGEPVRWSTSRGGAVITFRTPAAATAAVRQLDGAPLGPSRIRVALQAPADAAKPATPRSGSAITSSAAPASDRGRSAASTPSPAPGSVAGSAANGAPGEAAAGAGAAGRRRRGWDDGPPVAQPPAKPPTPAAAATGPDVLPLAASNPSPAPAPSPATAPSPAATPLAAAATPPSAAAAAPHAWKGRLGRPSVQPCEVVLLDGPPPDAPSGGLASSEPAAWPPLLEVRSRIPTTLLTGQKLPAVAPADVAVRRLAAAGPAHRHAFVRFMQYLSDKQRSGVVELGAAAKGGKLRTLYVIPPSRSVCDELRIAWEPQEILVVVVVPTVAKDAAAAP